MARTRAAESPDESENAAQPQADSSSASDTGRSQWSSRIGGGWTDAEAGVHLNEDHPNHRMTIKFDEKPSEAVRNVMKKEHGYRFDDEDQLWWKLVNFAKPRQTRQEAEDVAFQVATMIREETGLEQKKSFSLTA
jgi:hypothetical protein